MNNRAYTPVIIIGAARSGTNMLRDLLTQLDGFATWPCDEINYIWRYGNRDFSSDEFTPKMATSAVQRFIRRAFNRQAKKSGARFLVEKTCANSLRVGFVNAAIPDAKYLFLVRDGRDAALSARKRWSAPLDYRYIARKARFVPPSDVVHYGWRYFRNRLYRLRNQDKHLSSWGPRFEGMDLALARRPLLDVCGLQWRQCVTLASEQLAQFPGNRVMKLHYEQFVGDPQGQLESVVEFLGAPVDQARIQSISRGVRRQSVGLATRELASQEIAHLDALLATTLQVQGYSLVDGNGPTSLHVAGPSGAVRDPEGDWRRAG